jgi:hypothetical protein
MRIEEVSQGNPLPVSLTGGSLGAAAAWDGSSLDRRGQPTLEIFCTVAPSVAWTIQRSPDGATWIDHAAVINDGSGVSVSKTISALCAAVLKGGCFVRLNGGTGGTFFISASA